MHFKLTKYYVTLSVLLLGSISFAFNPDLPLKINGFGTIATTASDAGDQTIDTITPNSANYEQFTRLGINFSKRLSLDFSGVFQLIGLGTRDDFNADVDLVHLIYSPSDQISLIFGKQKLPSFLVSKYRETGYLTDWVREPWLLYIRNPIRNFIGASFEYRYDLTPMSNFIMEVYGGANDGKESIGALTIEGSNNDLLGLRFNYNSKYFTAFVNYLQMQTNANAFVEVDIPASALLGPNPALPDNLRLSLFDDFSFKLKIYTAGFRYDFKNMAIFAEYYGSDTPDDSISEDLDKFSSGYLGVKYHINEDWKTYLIFMASKAWGSRFILQAIPDSEQYIFGVNYIFSDAVKAKFAVENQNYYPDGFGKRTYTRYFTSIDFLF